jgi:hypothetical protein
MELHSVQLIQIVKQGFGIGTSRLNLCGGYVIVGEEDVRWCLLLAYKTQRSTAAGGDSGAKIQPSLLQGK